MTTFNNMAPSYFSKEDLPQANKKLNEISGDHDFIFECNFTYENNEYNEHNMLYIIAICSKCEFIIKYYVGKYYYNQEDYNFWGTINGDTNFPSCCEYKMNNALE